MAGPYHTPGVYVEEISKFPPSVAQVETAIPAFIGYTEKVIVNGIPNPPVSPVKDNPGSMIPIRIKSMVDYEESFGGPFNEGFSVSLVDANAGQTDPEGNALPPNFVIDQGPAEPELFYRMYYSLQMYFANGGGPCYIISTGLYDAANPSVGEEDLIAGLVPLEKEDEPTIIIFPDAVALGTAGLGTARAEAAAAEAEKLAAQAAEAAALANDDPSDDAAATAAKEAAEAADLAADTAAAAALAAAEANAATFYSIFTSAINLCAKLKDRITLCDLYLEDVDIFRNNIGTSNLSYAAAYHPYLKTILTYAYDEAAVVINGFGAVTKLKDDNDKAASLFHENNGLYHQVKGAIAKYSIVLPPSSIIAGVYASVDSDRGVFKAPANVGLNGVVEPTISIDDSDQEGLNVDVTGGKSINAIRKFTGKGILVWGARTLAGNDNEWRYISVRRFFNMVEESIKKASGQFVFEPNDANTWTKVRAMIENFLFLQWRGGALAGAKPEQAFYVRVGLGETMSAQDILEGRMIVEIGMAAVRPAEFIIMQFSHKMQEA